MKLVIFPLLIAVSLTVGLLIPAYYDWTGADQSRPAPVVVPTAIGVLLAGISACCLLPWLRCDSTPGSSGQNGRSQFQIRTVLAITAAIALLMFALANLPKIVIAGGVLLLAFAYLGRGCAVDRQSRLPAAAALACMYLPFAWVVSWGDLMSGKPEMIGMFLGLPNLFSTLLMGGLLGQHAEKLFWLAMLLTAAQLAMATWLIRLGLRRAIALMIFSLVSSTFGSFILNALVRV